MTSLKKLDYVLEKTHHSRDYFHVWEDLSKDEKLAVNQHDLNMMLNKLRRDGYIDFIAGERYVTGQQVGEGMYVRRNFEGDLFVEQGGYVEKERVRIEKDINESLYRERAETLATRLADWTQNLANRTADLTFWTRLVAIGAIGLVLWEVFAFALEHH